MNLPNSCVLLRSRSLYFEAVFRFSRPLELIEYQREYKTRIGLLMFLTLHTVVGWSGQKAFIYQVLFFKRFLWIVRFFTIKKDKKKLSLITNEVDVMDTFNTPYNSLQMKLFFFSKTVNILECYLFYNPSPPIRQFVFHNSRI